MKFSWSLLAFVFLPALTMAVVEIKDIDLYKPCIIDSTACPDNQTCIQYFCYPKVAGAQDPLKSCKKNTHCPGWRPSKTEKCAKFGQNGVCVAAKDHDMCESHEECEGNGEKCCNDYCCSKAYFDAIMKAPCSDDICKVIFFS